MGRVTNSLLPVLLLATACSGGQTAATAPRPERRPERPKPVCLILSVGAAKGLAHIGVVNALKEQGVDIKCVVGTSMGSLVGGLFASAPHENLTDRYRNFAQEYDQATRSDAGGGLFTGVVLGLAVGAVTGGTGAALAMGGIAGGTIGAGTVDLVSLRRMQGVLDDFLGHVQVQETVLPFGTLSQALEVTGAKLEPKDSGSLAEAITESISNPLIFPDITIGHGSRIDPGSDPTAAIPLRYACSRFPHHQFIISNVTDQRVIDEKDMNCDWVEVKPQHVDVNGERAMRAFPAELGALVREGRRAALSALDFKKLGGHNPRSRDVPCKSWAISKIEWTMPPTKETGEDWDGDGSAPDVVVHLNLGEGHVLSGPKSEKYSGAWKLNELVPLQVGQKVSAWTVDVDFAFDDPGLSEAFFVPSNPEQGATSEHFSSEFICVE